MIDVSLPGPRALHLHAFLLALGVSGLCACTGSAVGRVPGPAEIRPARDAAAAARVPPGPPSTEVHSARLAVRFGDVKELASVLADIFQPGSGRQEEIRAILVDDHTGEIVVLGTDAGIERVRRVIHPACSPEPGDADAIDVVYLEHVDARSVMKLVDPLVDHPTRITADEATNAILVRGDAGAIARVKSTVAELDVARPK